MLSHSVLSDSATTWTSLLGSSVVGDSPGKNTGVGCHALLQGTFPTQGLNPGQWNPGLADSLPSEPLGKPVRDLEDSTDEGLPSGVGDEEQKCKDLVFFLLHCFKNSCRLASAC